MSASEAAGEQGVSDLEALAEAERSGAPFLIFRDPEDRQRVFCFGPDSASASVGRLPSSDLVIDWDRQISRRHARFERAADGWVLVDDGLSSNGTFINDVRLSGRRQLKDGDVVRVGATVLVFRSPASIAGSPESDAVPPVNRPPTPAKVRLSSTQRRVLETLRRLTETETHSSGPTTEELIAEELVLSVAEVRGHLEVLCAKLGVEPLPLDDQQTRLVERAYATGLISGHAA